MTSRPTLEAQREAEAATPRAWLAQATEGSGAREAACEAFAAEAEEHGFCMPCWAKSTCWGLYPGKPRKIRHRKPGNCPATAGRRRAQAAECDGTEASLTTGIAKLAIKAVC